MRRAEWPLVGRAEELRLLSAIRPGGREPGGVVLAGAAGVGKTRLARESCVRARRRGASTYWATATASARSIPLGAFELAADTLGADPTQVLHRAITALERRAGTQGVLLAVDDAHLLDELSATLLLQIVLRGITTVVVTLRTGEPAPDAVTVLWKDGHLPRLELQPLAEQETAALLEARLGGAVESSTAHALHSITQGNALYLRHLVDEELATARLRDDLGMWRWTGRPTLSEGLTELLVARIGALSTAERDVVDLLAFGEPLDVTMVGELTDADAVERTESRGLVAVSEHGDRWQARLAHPLHGELRRAACGELRARRLRGLIAGALAGHGGVDDPIRLASLMLDSDLSPDLGVLTAGAKRALELTDFVLAERLARAALGAGGGFEARLALGMALSWTARGAAADDELATLERIAADDAQRARASLPRVGNLLWTLGDCAAAAQALDAARASVRDRLPALELDAMRSVVDGFAGRSERGADTAAEVLGNRECSSDAVIIAAYGLTMSGGGLGRMQGLSDAVTRVRALTSSPSVGLVRVALIGGSWTRALRLAGELTEAAEFADREVALHAADPGPARMVAVSGQGRVSVDRGQVRTGARQLRDVAGPALPPAWSYSLLLPQLAPLAMIGDLAEARAGLAEAQGHPRLALFDPDLTLAQAWIAAVEGALSSAVDHAHRAAGQAAETQQTAVEVVALHTAVQLGDRTVAGRLAELATRVDGPRAPAAAAHAAALAADDGDALIAASERIEALGALLVAMDAAAQAALAYRRHDQRGAAHAALARAQRLATLCEDPSTPALVAAAAPLPLTGREREIVTLAAGGLTNREIADRLVVSVRTIEGHLYRANTKLGTSTRAELTALLAGR